MILQETSAGLRVVQCVKGSAADAKGLPLNSRLVAIGRNSVEGLSQEEVTEIIKHTQWPLILRVAEEADPRDGLQQQPQQSQSSSLKAARSDST